MVELWFPYGSTEVPVRVPEENLQALVVPREPAEKRDTMEVLQRSILEPIGSGSLSDVLGKRGRVALIVEDTPHDALCRRVVSFLVDRLLKLGLERGQLTIIVSPGFKLRADDALASRLLPAEVLQGFRYHVHDPTASETVKAGITKRGVEVYLNRAFTESDAKILLSEVRPNPFIGFMGGPSCILPGVSALKTVEQALSLLLGKDGRGDGHSYPNLLYQETLQVAEMAGVDLAFNYVTDYHGDLVGAYFGSLTEAAARSLSLAESLYRVVIERKPEIVIVGAGGDPYDRNLYDACEALVNALGILKDDSIIVMVAECSEGVGDTIFYEWAKEFKDPEEMEAKLKRRFSLSGYKAYIVVKATESHKTYAVTSLPDYYAAKTFRMRTTRTCNSGLQLALRLMGKDAKVLAMPYGSSTISHL